MERDAVLNVFGKVDREGAEVTSAGRAFQTRAPATEKARRPTVASLTAGTHRSSEAED